MNTTFLQGRMATVDAAHVSVSRMVAGNNQTGQCFPANYRPWRAKMKSLTSLELNFHYSCCRVQVLKMKNTSFYQLLFLFGFFSRGYEYINHTPLDFLLIAR